MEKKLQVFVSSTFTDLIEERQVAVESILNAGHIPAGMELFKAGDESQKETIKRWIDESDAYMLILGGRYGTMDESTGKSYTHWEYDYAGEIGIPRFAIVIVDDALDEKIKDNGKSVMEIENHAKYIEFKDDVLSKTSKFFSDVKDIRLYVLESLKEFERDKNLTGWISGKRFGNYEKLLEENHSLLKDNNKLKDEKEKLESRIEKGNEIDGFSYNEVKQYLDNIEVKGSEHSEGILNVEEPSSILKLFVKYKQDFAVGLLNRYNADKGTIFLYYHVAPELITFNLVEKVKVAGVKYERIQTSKLGNKFMARYGLEEFSKVKL